MTWFTPSVGAMSTELCLFNSLQKPQFWSMHSATDLFKFLKPRTQLQIFLITQKPFAHIAAEVVHAHSCDLTFLTKIALASHQFILHQNPNPTPLPECLFIHCTYYKTMDLNHGHPEPKTLDLNHGFITKRKIWLNPDTPKTILSPHSRGYPS